MPAATLVVWQHETQGPDDVRRHPPEHFALHERFPHQTEFQIFEITQPAMDELGRGRGGAAG